jgi:tetratricopeptide (TPR) repeat protein
MTVSGRMTRHDMKQDDAVVLIEKVRKYSTKHPGLVRYGLAGAAGLLVLLVAGSLYFSQRGAAAAELLRRAQFRFSAQISAEGASPAAAVPTFASEAERDRAALELFDQLAARYPRSSEGRLAGLYQGLILARTGRLPEAEAALGRFLQRPTSPALAMVARTQLADVLTRKGDAAGALSSYSAAAEDPSGSYPRDWALYYLARELERQGKTQEAVEAYRKITTEFPSSPHAFEAGKKAQASDRR